MLKFNVLLAFCGFCAAASISSKTSEQIQSNQVPQLDKVSIVKSVGQQQSDGSYFYAYEAADGSFREEVGIVKHLGSGEEELEISGVYRYYDGNGQKVEVSYMADKNGFVPQGTNIRKEITEAARTAVQSAEQKFRAEKTSYKIIN